MRGFVSRFGLEAMTNLDGDDALWDGMGVIAHPAWIAVPTEGDVEVIHGSLGRDELDRIIDELT